MKHYYLLSATLFLVVSATLSSFAQGQFEFETLEHDFGTIKEEVGSAEYQFVFTNEGDAPIIIKGVKASCGCTTPDWTSDPVPAGGSGFVKAKYSTRNRPGSFRKSLTITSNATESSKKLYITGKVTPKTKTVAQRLPREQGGLRLPSEFLNLSKMTTEKPLTKSFEVYNNTDSVVYLLDKFEGPSFIKVSIDSNAVKPRSSANLNVWYDPVHEDNLGINSHSISFYTSDAPDQPKTVSVMARIEEYFEPLNEKQLAKAPRLMIEDRFQDLGTLGKGEKKTAKFLVKNGGVKPLNIRKIEPNCGCVQVKLDDYDLKGGETTWLHATFDATGRRGRQTKSVSVFSNDPNDPTQLVSIKVSVNNQER